jgi:serine/threonine protein kinase
MLYSMITGFRPFQGNSAETVCFKVMNTEPVPVTSFQHNVPPELDAIVARAIAKDPADRFQSGAEMANQIWNFRERSASLGEATSFFTRVLQKDAAASAQRNRGAQRGQRLRTGLFWGAVAATIALAGMPSVWRWTGGIRGAAAMQPPAAHAPSAPQIVKSQPSAVIAHRVTLAKKLPKIDAVAATPAMAKVQVEILHHFTGGRASIWIDDQLVFDQNLRGNDQRHPLFRTVEMNQTSSFELASGKHVLQVRVVSPASTYDQIESLDADLPAGSEHVLQVNCDKRKMQVTLQ